MNASQMSLFDSEQMLQFSAPFPSTRYQGSKRNLAEWIWENISGIRFNSALDIFGGTGSVSHMLKRAGIQVTYNDYLEFNWHIGLALIENSHIRLSNEEIEKILSLGDDNAYPSTIQEIFEGIYYTAEENRWLDRTLCRIGTTLVNPYKQAIARFALFQSSIAKRPFNLFHRANLYLREAQVKRSFGNKTTWDTPFEALFQKYAREANAAIFDNGRANRAICADALAVTERADLVYIDPPYLNQSGVGVDYRDFYHFLEGMTAYSKWEEQIDFSSKHRRLQRTSSPWHRADTILDAFDDLFNQHRDSILVVSYRDDGIPTKTQLVDLLGKYKSSVHVTALPKTYVLSNQQSHELLLVAR